MRPILVLLSASLLALAGHAADPPRVRSVSTVVLLKPELPANEDVRAELARRLGPTLPIQEVTRDTEKNAMLVHVAGGIVGIGMRPRPVPNRELQDVCRFAWQWPQACESVARHQAHILVSVVGTGLDRVGVALLATHTMAALMDSPNAIAGYWGATLQPREVFVAQSAAASRKTLPIPLWINFRLSSDPQAGWSLVTRGMDFFGLMEIEAKDAPVDGQTLFSLAARTATVLIDKGPVIKNGDTVAMVAGKPVLARREPSFRRAGQTALRLVFQP
jgi:hypothetical protein